MWAKSDEAFEDDVLDSTSDFGMNQLGDVNTYTYNLYIYIYIILSSAHPAYLSILNGMCDLKTRHHQPCLWLFFKVPKICQSRNQSSDRLQGEILPSWRLPAYTKDFSPSNRIPGNFRSGEKT